MPPATSRSDQCVGNKGGVSGILYKWVNYGKGWRRRWFDLEDGVLSYYKIHHGPHHHHHHHQKIIIGQNSLRRISPHNNATSQLPSNPVGQLHLKVSSIRESRSDDKRFSVFTGTNKLHLRAETREDRVAWTDALQAAKDMFPRVSNSELLAPVDDFVVSTEKLRQRLLKECVSEATIRDSEQIMKNEFAALQNQLVLLKQKNWQLFDTLEQLEVYVMISRKKHANSIQNSSSLSSAQNPVHPSASETTQINCPAIGCF